MNDIPDATELLAIARSTLLDKLLPHLPDDLRYDALMVANAMAIAAREHQAGDAAAQSEVERLTALLGEQDALPGAAALKRRLAAQIRAGRFDANERAALLDHLARTVADELAISNPRALET